MVARSLLPGVFLLLCGARLSADSFAVTFEAATLQSAVLTNATAGCVGSNPACVTGVQNFDSWTGGPLVTDYGTGNVITGSYSGGMVSTVANQFGGAGGTGRYITIPNGRTYTISLTNTAAIPGVDYFGLWYSSLDSGSLLQFFNNNTLLFSFTPASYIAIVGACPSSKNAFCGNPNPQFKGQNSGEQYAFLNFYDQTAFFNKIVFTQTAAGGFESDNHTVGYLNPVRLDGTLIVPEPSSALFLLIGGVLFGGALFAAKRKRRSRIEEPVR